MVDYTKTCFIIMPFGKKDVGNRQVDFDRIYEDVFEPAVSTVELPEGGLLEPHRTDKDFFTGDITVEMFHYLEYSRFALVDITGLNANVFYELGVRHRVRPIGTAIFRQDGTLIPFDIKNIKAFAYQYEPEREAEASRALIRQVLTESLVRNRIDSPVRVALGIQQRQGGEVEAPLREAENAIRSADFERAIRLYREALNADPANALVRMRLGLLLRDRGRWGDALVQFDAACAAQPRYGEAWRERGIARNKLAWDAQPPPPPSAPAPGEECLRRAIEINPEDFDALASLGGALKRAGRIGEASEMYARSTEVSNGHPYPLLNWIKLSAHATGRFRPEPRHKRALRRAERERTVQAGQNPPYDRPWCFFDLAEIRLYDGAVDQCVELIRRGLGESEADWQGMTFLASLELLEPASADIPGLDRCLLMLRQWRDTGDFADPQATGRRPS